MRFTEELRIAYDRIVSLLDADESALVESFETVAEVNRYRERWLPSHVKVLLLAESHVYTTKQDFSVGIKPISTMKSGHSQESELSFERFVRFVYCLGYGEQEILDAPLEHGNYGTPQYWKLLLSCWADPGDIQQGDPNSFQAIAKRLSKKKTATAQRLSDKLELLQHLQSSGVWLLDESIMAIYAPKPIQKPTGRVKKLIFDESWHSFCRPIIEKLQPERVLVIGKGTYDRLQAKLHDLEIPIDWVKQPQGCRQKGELLEMHKKVFEFCNATQDSSHRQIPR